MSSRSIFLSITFAIKFKILCISSISLSSSREIPNPVELWISAPKGKILKLKPLSIAVLWIATDFGEYTSKLSNLTL